MPRLRATSAACVALLGALFATRAAAHAAPSFGHAIVQERFGAPRLVVDGRPFFFWGGAFFYDRIAPERWRASMLAMRRLGANTLDLYVPWSWHEIADGEFDFDGRTDPRRNLREVLRLGKELGFRFIVRPGPVIRNEWRNGGYPAWLLTRPEYDMPLHDVLEGRYPATATLQNAHSDDAAGEWLRNRTHLRYASRWLHRVLDEFRPVADRVLAVQLDDDQGAYIDNQTYPAPHLQRYLRWLDAQVRDVVGPLTPTFINTYQMREPWSSPAWTMGNWYQSDAYTVGMHDRVDLDFSTLLLRTNRRGPLAQSEFQAGWLAGPEDPAPRPADPRNTTLALDELVALGTQGVIDFPMQDTLAEPGWEAPFSNAFYGWDAALSFDDLTGESATHFAPYPPPLPARYAPTAAFGVLAQRLGALLATAHRRADVAIAYGEPPPRADSSPPSGSAAIVQRVRDELRRCAERGLVCSLVDLHHPPRDIATQYADVVIGPELARADPRAAAALRAALRNTTARVASSVPARRGDAATQLVSPFGTLSIATNWSDAPAHARFGTVTAVIAAHSASLRVSRLALAALGAPSDPRRVSSQDCVLRLLAPAFSADGARLRPSALALAPPRAAPPPEGQTGAVQRCSVRVEGARAPRTIVVAATNELVLPSLDVAAAMNDGADVAAPPGGDRTALAPSAHLAVSHDGDVPHESAVVRDGVVLPELGARTITLRNDRLRLIVDPAAGARAFSLQALHAGPRDPSPYEIQRFGLGWSPNAFDATGAWRDDVDVPLPPSPRDFIARYTHTYPAGTFNRPYEVRVVQSGPRAVVRFRYTMPDANPPGVTFERIVTVEPASSRVVVDERVVSPPGGPARRAVVRSSLPFLARRPRIRPDGRTDDPVALDDVARDRAGALAAGRTALGTFRGGFAFVVSWPPRAVERAVWTPYRSTGTLALTLAPGWRRTVYSFAWVGDVAAARAFMEAERAWAAANPGPSAEVRGEVAKRYTQSPQKRPSVSSCGFESHLPQ